MLAEMSIIPVGKDVSISGYVAEVAEIIDKSGLDYRINPMGTVVEGSFDEIMGLVRQCHDTVMKDVDRVMITLSMDDRKDKVPPRLDKKVESVEKKLGHSLKKGV
jgi:uncharacterized protein (TIGR00106 family)